LESTSWYEPKVRVDLHVHHGIARQHALGQGFDHALFNRRDVFAGNHTALDRVDELKALAGFVAAQR